MVGMMFVVLAAACGDGGDDADTTDAQLESTSTPPSTAVTTATLTASASSSIVSVDATVDGVVDVGNGRGLYLRCSGSGAPTVILEGGDGDTSDSYRFAETEVAAVTRTCVYDRANLGRSGPAPGPRGLRNLVGDLEGLLDVAQVPAPYVLVGTSGGGYITLGFAIAHPDQVAGMVFVETAAPFVDPPPEILAETAWDHPSNVEQRDYLQVERDAWAALTEIGDIPVIVISNDYGPDAELEGERSNVEDQRALLELSPQAQQMIVETGHAVEEQNPQLVVDAILDTVAASR